MPTDLLSNWHRFFHELLCFFQQPSNKKRKIQNGDWNVDSSDSSDTDSNGTDDSASTTSSDGSLLNLCLLRVQLSSRVIKYHHIHISWEQHATMLVLEI